MSKRRKIIGAKVRLLVDTENRGGIKFRAGEVLEIWQAYRGYGLKSNDGRFITRIQKDEFEFFDEAKR